MSELYEYNALNQLDKKLTTYVWGYGLVVSETTGAFEVYYQKNAHGDVVRLADTAGKEQRRHSYDAFGNERKQDSKDNNPFRYCGEYYDKETGSLYLRARYYNPTTGRFLTADTHWNPQNMIYGNSGGANPSIAAIMQSRNLYIYCGGNPLMFVDPTGNAWYHWAICAAIVVVAAVATVVTAGGATAAMVAVTSVANGVAATTTASTVAAGAFVGASVYAGGAALLADDDSIEAFNNSADWGTVAGTALGGLVGAIDGYIIDKSTPKAQPLPDEGSGFPDTREALHDDVISKGYTGGEPSPNGYVVYKHPNGSRVNVKPSGEVIPTIRVPVDPNNRAWNAPRYNQRVYYNGVPIPGNSHSTGHFVEPFKR